MGGGQEVNLYTTFRKGFPQLIFTCFTFSKCISVCLWVCPYVSPYYSVCPFTKLNFLKAHDYSLQNIFK